MILYDSDQAAHRATVEGWVSATGRFWGNNEHGARYEGCTHVRCACGEVMGKGLGKCGACHEAENIARYAAMPRQRWNNEMLFSEATFSYYRNPEEAEDALEEGQTLADLRLVLCDPVYGPQLDDEVFYDSLPDDDNDVPDELLEALDAFNKAVRAAGVLSWSPGKFALELS